MHSDNIALLFPNGQNHDWIYHAQPWTTKFHVISVTFTEVRRINIKVWNVIEHYLNMSIHNSHYDLLCAMWKGFVSCFHKSQAVQTFLCDPSGHFETSGPSSCSRNSTRRKPTTCSILSCAWKDEQDINWMVNNRHHSHSDFWRTTKKLKASKNKYIQYLTK